MKTFKSFLKREILFPVSEMKSRTGLMEQLSPAAPKELSRTEEETGFNSLFNLNRHHVIMPSVFHDSDSGEGREPLMNSLHKKYPFESLSDMAKRQIKGNRDRSYTSHSAPINEELLKLSDYGVHPPRHLYGFDLHHLDEATNHHKIKENDDLHIFHGTSHNLHYFIHDAAKNNQYDSNDRSYIVMRSPTYTSGSISPRIAKGYAKPFYAARPEDKLTVHRPIKIMDLDKFNTNNVYRNIVHFHLKKNDSMLPIGNYSHYSPEREVLIPRESHFRIHSIPTILKHKDGSETNIWHASIINHDISREARKKFSN